VRNGRPTCEPATQPIRVYAAKIEHGRVWIDAPV
jgi:nitrite reductase/ring-hydroxylating ferredoxin subunit